jgi:hypothetical protein
MKFGPRSVQPVAPDLQKIGRCEASVSSAERHVWCTMLRVDTHHISYEEIRPSGDGDVENGYAEQRRSRH